MDFETKFETKFLKEEIAKAQALVADFSEEDHLDEYEQSLVDNTKDDIRELQKILERGYTTPSDFVLVAYGDWGGQVYWVVDQEEVILDNTCIQNLLEKVDREAWDCNEGEGKFFSRYFKGYVARRGGVMGGMGGGSYSPGKLWVHPNISHMRDTIARELDYEDEEETQA